MFQNFRGTIWSDEKRMEAKRKTEKNQKKTHRQDNDDAHALNMK